MYLGHIADAGCRGGAACDGDGRPAVRGPGGAMIWLEGEPWAAVLCAPLGRKTAVHVPEEGGFRVSPDNASWYVAAVAYRYIP